MFQESSFHKNEEIVRLKQQYDAIDREIAAYEISVLNIKKFQNKEILSPYFIVKRVLSWYNQKGWNESDHMEEKIELIYNIYKIKNKH